VCHALKTSIIDFIWNGKKPRIKYSVLISPISSGGLGLLDLDRMKVALRCKIIRKLFDNETELNPAPKFLVEYHLSKYKSLQLGCDTFRILLEQPQMKKLPRFHCELLQAWVNVTQHNYVQPMNAAELITQPLFENPFIGIHSIESFVQAKVLRIRDVILEYAPGFISPMAICELLDFKCNENQAKEFLSTLKKNIPKSWCEKINSGALREKGNSPPGCHIKNPMTDCIIDISTTKTRDIKLLIKKERHG